MGSDLSAEYVEIMVLQVSQLSESTIREAALLDEAQGVMASSDICSVRVNQPANVHEILTL